MRNWLILMLMMALFMTAVTGCGQPPAAEDLSAPAEEGGQTMDFRLSSPAFSDGQPIPVKFSCHGEDISPALDWSEPPMGAQTLALIMDDPDAPVGTWIHWVLFSIPANLRGLPEGIAAEPTLADGSRHGNNSWKRVGYGGPCPPSGTHHYVFKLYALDTKLDLSPGSSKEDLLKVMEGHVLAQAQLVGTFSKP